MLPETHQLKEDRARLELREGIGVAAFGRMAVSCRAEDPEVARAVLRAQFQEFQALCFLGSRRSWSHVGGFLLSQPGQAEPGRGRQPTCGVPPKGARWHMGPLEAKPRGVSGRVPGTESPSRAR
jgi:hypothetical protein